MSSLTSTMLQCPFKTAMQNRVGPGVNRFASSRGCMSGFQVHGPIWHSTASSCTHNVFNSLLTHTMMASQTWSNMLGKDHSWRTLIYGTLLPMPGLIYSRSPTCTKSKGWSCTMCQWCGTWQARKLWLHFYDGQFKLTAHSCRTSACLS
jgi:hypothetical protein